MCWRFPCLQIEANSTVCMYFRFKLSADGSSYGLKVSEFTSDGINVICLRSSGGRRCHSEKRQFVSSPSSIELIPMAIYKTWRGNLRIFITKIHPLVSKLGSSSTIQNPVPWNITTITQVNMMSRCPRAASAETKQGTAKIPGTRWSVM